MKTCTGGIKIFHRILNKSDKPLHMKLDKNRMGSNSRQKGYKIGQILTAHRNSKEI
jgi:hypothetical protein